MIGDTVEHTGGTAAIAVLDETNSTPIAAPSGKTSALFYFAIIASDEWPVDQLARCSMKLAHRQAGQTFIVAAIEDQKRPPTGDRITTRR
jgi:hypothetical protein